jgi:hypothetical protein
MSLLTKSQNRYYQGNEVEAVAQDVMKQLGGAPMEYFRKLIVKKPRTKLGKGTRVVVLGGGYGGSSSVI